MKSLSKFDRSLLQGETVVEGKVAVSWVFQKVHTCHVIKIKMTMWCISFTERQGKVKFEVYPFRFVMGEIFFQIFVTYKCFEMFNENLIYLDLAFIGQKTDRFLVNELFSYQAYLLPLSCHRRPSQACNCSQGRSSTLRPQWSPMSPGCPCMKEELSKY